MIGTFGVGFGGDSVGMPELPTIALVPRAHLKQLSDPGILGLARWAF